MTTVAAATTIIYTIYTIKTSLDKRFDKIEDILRNQDQRISKLEGSVEGVRGMLQTIVAFLFGQKTGTDNK